MTSGIRYFLSVAIILALSVKLYPQKDVTADTAALKRGSATTVEQALKKVNITGYIQPQYQVVESKGAACISGGNFEPNTSTRFMLRRGRLKATFNTKNAEYVFHIDATQNGVNIDEVYVALTDPWFKTMTFTTGIFNRPLGYEVGYSSGKLEFMERSRVVKAICPDEKDLCIMFSFRPRPENILHNFTINAGFFNGTGPYHRDFDDRKDLIAQLFYAGNSPSKLIHYRLGLSIQSGGYDHQYKQHYEWNDGYYLQPNDTLAKAVRSFKGFDGEYTAKWITGTTTLRGEYFFGLQSSGVSANRIPVVAPHEYSVTRNFNGGYIMFLHTLPANKIQFGIRYDWYDPNTKIAGNEIGAKPNTGWADIRYNTLAYGINYYCNANLKFLAWFDIITNESTQLSGYTSDLDDNLFTLRMQYTF